MSNQLGFYFLTDTVRNRMEWVNNKFQMMWRAATPAQKIILNPVMAEWWQDYSNWRTSTYLWLPGVISEVDAWELKADTLRNQFIREGNTAMTKLPGGRPPKARDAADTVIDAVKWGAVIVLSYIGYNVYKDLRADWKFRQEVRREAALRGQKKAPAVAGLGQTSRRRRTTPLPASHRPRRVR